MSSSFPPLPDNPNPFAYNPPTGNAAFPNQPYGGTGFGPPPRQPASLALSALFSLLLSLVSPVFICLCFPYLTAILSLAGIVMGHIALSRISKSGGTLSGGGLAIGGLAVGYPSLLFGLAFSAFIIFATLAPKDLGKPDPALANTPAGRLKAADNKINTDNDGVAHGNTPEAKALAEEYAQTMKTLREALFTKGKKGFSLSGGNFVTYCELHEGRCAFITHVPQYRKFDDDAKKSLAEIAWVAAQETVADTLDEGDELGVGMKGVVLYGKVMVGHVTAIGGEKRGLEKEGENNEEMLESFFALDPDEIPKPAPIKLDDPAKPNEPAPNPNKD